jgi:hypothetical protein
MAIYGNGLTSVSFGTIAGDGGPATTWEVLGSTVAGTMNWTSAEGTATEFFIEESDDPILRKTQSGSNTITWQCADISAQTMQKLFGGTVSGTGTVADPYVYDAPVDGVVAKEKSLKIVNGNGVVAVIPRASVSAQFNMAFAKDQVSQITITATILKPTKLNEPSYSFTYPGA